MDKTRRGAHVRVVSLVCVLLVMLAAGVQAIHVHPDSSKLVNHDCPICALAHTGASITVSHCFVPLFFPAAFEHQYDLSPKAFLLVSSLYIRPPPAA